MTDITQESLQKKQQAIDRVFHDLKHDLIMLNPRENYAKATDCGED